MTIARYSKTAVIIHWLMAIMIISMIMLGFYMADLPKGSDARSWFFALHKSLGLTLALLALFRLGWRFVSAPPALPTTVGRLQTKMATAAHHLLYLMMFVQPITGYISSSFSGYKTKFWGMPLPHWGWKSPELNELFTEIHEISAFCLIGLIVLHIAGVIYHIHKKQPELLQRMWFGR